MSLDLAQLKESSDYQRYHADVVEACVRLMGENCRSFFRDHCDYIEEFLNSEDPSEVAEQQRESL